MKKYPTRKDIDRPKTKSRYLPRMTFFDTMKYLNFKKVKYYHKIGFYFKINILSE